MTSHFGAFMIAAHFQVLKSVFVIYFNITLSQILINTHYFTVSVNGKFRNGISYMILTHGISRDYSQVQEEATIFNILTDITGFHFCHIAKKQVIKCSPPLKRKGIKPHILKENISKNCSSYL